MPGLTEPSRAFMESHVAVCWNDNIVVLSSYNSRKIWMYNLWIEQWWKFTSSPGKRFPIVTGQRGVQIKSEIYMFGGVFADKVLWKLMRKTKNDPFEWSTIQIEDCTKSPSLRVGHCAWEFDQKMWIFGGYGAPPAGYLNEYGDFTGSGPRKYNNQLLSYDPFTQKWINLACSGVGPAPRAYASSAIIDKKVYLCGGEASSMPGRDDLYELDMHSFTWTHIEATGLRFDGQLSMSLIPATVNKLIFYGNNKYRESFIRIFDLQSHTVKSITWKELSETKVSSDSDCTSMTGLSGNAVILGEFIQLKGQTYNPKGQTYNPIINLRLQRKSLQQLAMQTMYHKVDSSLWEMLPKKLKGRLDGCRVSGTTRNSSCRNATSM